MKTWKESVFLKISIGIVLGTLLFWDFFSQVSSVICKEHIVSIEVMGDERTSANFYLNWFNNLKIIKNEGFREIEENHFVTEKPGAKLVFRADNVKEGNLFCVVGSTYGKLKVTSGLNTLAIDCYKETLDNLTIKIEQSINLNLMLNVLTAFFSLIVGCLVSLCLKLLLIFFDRSEKKAFQIWGMYFLVAVFFYGGMLQTLFSIDDYTYYALYSAGQKFSLDDYMYLFVSGGLRDGRVIWSNIYILLDVLCNGIFLIHQKLIMIVCFFVLAMISYVIFKLFSTYIIKIGLNVETAVVFICSGLFVFNPFVPELLNFHKVNVSYLFAMLCAVLAVDAARKRKYVFALLMLELSVFNYQPYAATFVIIYSTLLLLDYVKNKIGLYEWIKEVFAVGVLYSIAVVSNFIWIIFWTHVLDLGSSRANLNGMLMKIQKLVLEIGKVVASGHGRMSSPYYLVCVFVLFAISIILLKKNMQKYKKGCIPIFIFTICLILITTFYFQLVTELWNVDERTCFVILGLPGVIGMLLLLLIIDRQISAKSLLGVMGIIGIAFFLDSQIDIGRIKATNIADTELCRIYESEIEAYEQSTGILVDTVGFIQSSHREEYYRYGINNSSEPYWSALFIEWARLDLLNMVSRKEYKEINYDNKSYDWNRIRDELESSGIVYFEGNVAFLEIY